MQLEILPLYVQFQKEKRKKKKKTPGNDVEIQWSEF